MKKIAIVVVLQFFIGLPAWGQSLRWTSFSALEDSLRINKKPLMIFIHTDWCTYCKAQEQTTFADDTIGAQLNQQFYCLKLNAESPQDIHFLGRRYQYTPSGAGEGHHQLAEFLGKQDGQLTFPTTVFLNKQLQLLGRVPGYLSPKTLKKLLSTR